MSRLSTNERQVCDTGGNVRASYLSFRLAPTDDITSDLDESDDWSEDDEEEEDCENPTIVDLSNKKMTSFTLSQLTSPDQLKYLYLQDNKLKTLPEDLFLKCLNLEWLDVRNNCLTCLPCFHSHKK